MVPTEDSETSAEFKRMPGIYPKEHVQYKGRSVPVLKSYIMKTDGERKFSLLPP